jgi:hypothetical protein
MSAELIAGIVAAALALAVLLWLLLRRRRRSTIRSALAAVAIEHIRDVVVPDGIDGEIHIEHLLLTARGVLVLNVKTYDGVVFAGDRLDQWTAIGAGGRSTFNNPLPSLYDRVAAVRQIIRDVDVTGYVVFPSSADFSKGRPADVMLPEDVQSAYAKPDKAALGRVTEAFAPQWEVIRSAARPATF